MDALRVIDDMYPAAKGTYAVIAQEKPIKAHWWNRPKNYLLCPVLYWGIVAKVVPGHSRTNDEVVPFIRYQRGLEDAQEIGGFVGLCMPGDKPTIFKDVIKGWIEAMQKHRADAQKEQQKQNNKLLN